MYFGSRLFQYCLVLESILKHPNYKVDPNIFLVDRVF